MRVIVDGIVVSHFRMDPTGRIPVEPSFYNEAINRALGSELRDSRYFSSMPRVDMSNRDSLIAWMYWNDRNSIVRDEDAEADGFDPLTLHEAQELFLEILNRD